MKLKSLALTLSLTVCLSACSDQAKESGTPFSETETTVSQTESTKEQTAVTTPQSKPETTTNASPAETQEPTEKQTALSNESDNGENIIEKSVENRLLWDEVVVQENWREVLTTEEAFANFDAITAPPPKGASPEDEIVLLMNRNVLCFDTAYVIPFEFIDPEQEFNYSSDDILHARVRSEYFNTIQDIKNLYAKTYTEECANLLFYGTEDRPLQTFIKDENGIIWVDMRCVTVWSTNPFYHPSYIEIVSQSESDCEFLWHYVSYDYGDYFTDYLPHEFFPFHNQIKCYAVKENDEWKLTFLIYDNPIY